MKKAIVMVVILALAVSGAAFANTAADAAEKSLSVRPFQFKHKAADKAAAMIKPLLSAEGTMSIQPAANTLVVTDRAENLKAIAAALAKYDAPAAAVQISIRVVSAARVQGAGNIPEELKDVAAKVRILRYNALENLGSATVEAQEGQPGMVTLENGYRADFKVGEFDPASKSVQIADFKLFRAENEQLSELLTTTLNLKVGVTHILSLAKSPESDRAVMLVLSARQ